VEGGGVGQEGDWWMGAWKKGNKRCMANGKRWGGRKQET